MNFDEYQKKTRETSIYPKEVAVVYPALGLNGEAGEVAEQVKKAIRDDGGVYTDDRLDKLHKELGDVLWYVSETATDLGLSLGDIAQGNIDKLAGRKTRGTLQGSGNDR